jgi:hypothetical protein
LSKMNDNKKEKMDQLIKELQYQNKTSGDLVESIDRLVQSISPKSTDGDTASPEVVANGRGFSPIAQGDVLKSFSDAISKFEKTLSSFSKVTKEQEKVFKRKNSSDEYYDSEEEAETYAKKKYVPLKEQTGIFGSMRRGMIDPENQLGSTGKFEKMGRFLGNQLANISGVTAKERLVAAEKYMHPEMELEAAKKGDLTPLAHEQERIAKESYKYDEGKAQHGGLGKEEYMKKFSTDLVLSNRLNAIKTRIPDQMLEEQKDLQTKLEVNAKIGTKQSEEEEENKKNAEMQEQVNAEVKALQIKHDLQQPWDDEVRAKPRKEKSQTILSSDQQKGDKSKNKMTFDPNLKLRTLTIESLIIKSMTLPAGSNVGDGTGKQGESGSVVGDIAETAVAGSLVKSAWGKTKGIAKAGWNGIKSIGSRGISSGALAGAAPLALMAEASREAGEADIDDTSGKFNIFSSIGKAGKSFSNWSNNLFGSPTDTAALKKIKTGIEERGDTYTEKEAADIKEKYDYDIPSESITKSVTPQTESVHADQGYSRQVGDVDKQGRILESYLTDGSPVWRKSNTTSGATPTQNIQSRQETSSSQNAKSVTPQTESVAGSAFKNEVDTVSNRVYPLPDQKQAELTAAKNANDQLKQEEIRASAAQSNVMINAPTNISSQSKAPAPQVSPRANYTAYERFVDRVFTV